MQKPSFKSLIAKAMAVLCIAAAGTAQADVVFAQKNANSPDHAFFDLVNVPIHTTPYYINTLDINISGNAEASLHLSCVAQPGRALIFRPAGFKPAGRFSLRRWCAKCPSSEMN